MFKPALITDALSVIVAHNHPSGNPTPSIEGIELTKRLKKAGELLSVPVLDHIIIGYSYFSMESNAEYHFDDEDEEGEYPLPLFMLRYFFYHHDMVSKILLLESLHRLTRNHGNS